MTISKLNKYIPIATLKEAVNNNDVHTYMTLRTNTSKCALSADDDIDLYAFTKFLLFDNVDAVHLLVPFIREKFIDLAKIKCSSFGKLHMLMTLCKAKDTDEDIIDECLVESSINGHLPVVKYLYDVLDADPRYHYDEAIILTKSLDVFQYLKSKGAQPLKDTSYQVTDRNTFQWIIDWIEYDYDLKIFFNTDIKIIKDLRNTIKPGPYTLYRGVRVPKHKGYHSQFKNWSLSFDNFKSSHEFNLNLKELTSWSVDESVALAFAGYTGVVLKLVVNDPKYVIADLSRFGSFIWKDNEKEVILYPGTFKVTIINVLNSHKFGKVVSIDSSDDYKRYYRRERRRRNYYRRDDDRRSLF